MSKIIILSGGLDSTCLLYNVYNKSKEVSAIMFYYGQRHSRELELAEINCKKLRINYKKIDISFFKELADTSALINKNKDVPHIKDVVGEAQPITYVPNRNMMFLSIAAAAAENVNAKEIYYGAAEVDTHSGHWDCSLDFLYNMNKILGLNRKQQIEIKAPYITYSKADIINDGISNNVNFLETHTCYNGEEIACGTCSACSSRIQGFIETSYIDPIRYKIEIPWKKYNCKPI
jgi:7-cyano-7-deazaguanine synthase